MLFSSVPFLFYFLPAALLIYFAAPRQLKNAVLLLASLFFYAWGEPKYMLLMLVSIVQGYGFGLLIEKHRGQKASKVFLTLSILVSLGLLGYFKYADFFLSSVNAVTGLSLPLLKLSLPIGISFYTFQVLSYVIDVYRGETAAQRQTVLPKRSAPFAASASASASPAAGASRRVRLSASKAASVSGAASAKRSPSGVVQPRVKPTPSCANAAQTENSTSTCASSASGAPPRSQSTSSERATGALPSRTMGRSSLSESFQCSWRRLSPG